MICDLIFKVGDQEIPLVVESESPTYPTNEEILNALRNPINAENKSKLYSYIKDNYDKAQILDVDKLFTGPDGQFCMPNGLVGNTTVEQLAKKFPGKFPEGVTAKVLAVKRLKSGGRTISGRCITSNGEELFIINDSTDVEKLAGFLTIRKILQENTNYYDESSENYADLELLRQKLKKRSIPELILDFIEYTESKTEKAMNSNPFRKIYFTNSKGEIYSAYNFLDQISRQIRQQNQLVQYSDPFINAISKLHRYRDKDTKAIKFDELFEALNAFYPDLLKQLNADTVQKFRNRIKETDFNKDLFKIVIENKPLIYTLLTNLIKNDRRYQYEVASITKDEVKLKKKFETLKTEFGFNYEAIHTFDLINNDFRGYKIYAFNYDGKKIFIYSRNYLTEDTPIYKIFDTREEVENYINEKIQQQKLKTNSFLRFKYRSKVNGVQDQSKYIYKIENSSQVYIVGSIVESLDIPIDPLTQLKSDEKNLLDSKEYTLQDFYNLVDKWELDDNIKEYIKNKINNPEKAVAYIYKINETLKTDRTNGESLQSIADYVSNASKVAYYINSNNGKDYTLIPTEPNVVEKWKEDKSVPVVQLLQAMQAILQKKVGVTLNLLTSSQIAQKFPNIDPNTVKAFIYEGQIYVNTTIASGEDLLHEYTHIMLGVLKSNPESRAHYEQLVNNVWNLAKQSERTRVEEDYANSSKMDIREELFARKFAEYLLYNRDTNNIFQQQEAYMKDGISTIFDLIGDEPLSKTYSRTIQNIFKRFSSDIATLLESNTGLDFDLITNSRRKSTFINNQIKEGKITEIC